MRVSEIFSVALVATGVQSIANTFGAFEPSGGLAVVAVGVGVLLAVWDRIAPPAPASR